VPLFLVDRDLPGITPGQIQAAQQRILEAGRLLAPGAPVLYLRSTFVPSLGHLIDLFEAPDAARVREVNELAQFPMLRMVEVVDLTPTEQEAVGRHRGGRAVLRGRPRKLRPGSAP
jgi:hypothetical protein